MPYDDDLPLFFEPTEHAAPCVITGPNAFTLSLNVIFNDPTHEVGIYDETQVESAAPFFQAQTAELAGVRKGMTATIGGVGYKIERVRKDGTGVSNVFLSE